MESARLVKVIFWPSFIHGVDELPVIVIHPHTVVHTLLLDFSYWLIKFAYIQQLKRSSCSICGCFKLPRL
ncbi:hypothetical protein SNOG_09467 [Parastagonospora nodorum SN15]|uniref:Uncharacterized protein n=1 Tax=Phaeosphaeria nodorum (strain SN15 / ATCC MYA-4574 / FGSC 10173) TaxID=321614 RepID=Q0UFJ7_PHANO|nr:hypothetical protein SNOG_09467 [Parastagonospora nodorum SN15]EAT82732.2 hypothetical protein SNOG_09467 [Parastagonospora nodorum SN15]